jgi:methionyl-tRNA formyltransferase
LPYYSGAAPINWSIIYGEYITGITAFFLEESIDNGPIVFQKKDFIYYFDTLLTLRNRLISNSKNLILKTINSIIIGKYFLKKQNFYNNYMKYSPKIFKKNCQINWNKKSNYIYNFVRGLSPHPCSWTKLNDKFFKIISLEVIKSFNLNPGQIHTDGYSYLLIGTKDHPVSIKLLQPSNKNPLDIKSFFNGNII